MKVSSQIFAKRLVNISISKLEKCNIMLIHMKKQGRNRLLRPYYVV